MNELIPTILTSDAVKEKAKSLGADLVGIADGALMDQFPPNPDNPRTPSHITEIDGARVIVLAKRISFATSRLPAWNDQHKFYGDELLISALEELALDLVFWLEDNGVPGLMVPYHHVDPLKFIKGEDTQATHPLSAEHAAVEAGLGTLGLNHQLITPEYGPRVILGLVMTSADIEPDQKIDDALCLGPECGRCLAACPADAVQHWDRDWKRCDGFRSPFGFEFMSDYLTDILTEEDQLQQIAKLRGMESSEIFQAMLRGSGIITGCRRCADVCPVGNDYETLLKKWVDKIPEETPEKLKRLKTMVAEATLPEAYAKQHRWIGEFNLGN
jgi:epoxyqueuosine reductase